MPDAADRFPIRDTGDGTVVIVLEGDVTGATEPELMDAYQRASDTGATSILLDFNALDYMNSGGIGLLVTLLVRARRAEQRVFAFGLSDHYRQIFDLTRLDEAIGIHPTEAEALAAARVTS